MCLRNRWNYVHYLKLILGGNFTLEMFTKKCSDKNLSLPPFSMGFLLDKTVLFDAKRIENKHKGALEMYASCSICKSPHVTRTLIIRNII